MLRFSCQSNRKAIQKLTAQQWLGHARYRIYGQIVQLFSMLYDMVRLLTKGKGDRYASDNADTAG